MRKINQLKTSFILIGLIIQISVFGQLPLTADAGPDQVICSSINGDIDTHFIGGQPSAVGGVPPYTYIWNFSFSTPWASDTSYASDFFNDTTLANPTLNWMAIINWPELPPFTLTVTDSLGNTATDTIKLWLSSYVARLPNPHFYIHEGDTVNYTDGPDIFGGIGTLTYLWRPNHGLLDSTNYGFTAVPNQSIEYYVIATDSVGCSKPGQPGLVSVIVFPLGIEDEEPNTSIKIYPNPASNMLQIEVKEQGLNGTEFTLIDMLGKVVLTTNLHSNQNQIDVGHLARGAYSFRVVDSVGKIVLE